MSAAFTFYEFFAGGGMARAGLGAGWECLFANDFDKAKAETYRANWGEEDLRLGNVFALTAADLPGRADLAWASSPCQDLSLAGKRAGLSGGRSFAFWGFWRLMQALDAEGRAPLTIVIENVVGLLTSHGGADFTALCEALATAGYRYGALEIEAALFLPQSRPRLFVVATRTAASAGRPVASFHSRKVLEAHARLPLALQDRWIWWDLPAPPARNADLMSVLEPSETAEWHSEEQAQVLLGLLSPTHQERLETAQTKGPAAGALYRRIREEDGVKVQRAEVRFDGLAGCLRTPGGGSSRQFVVWAEPGGVRTRLLTAREGARLMGLPDSYVLPKATTRALHVVGDGVAAPVVRHLAAHVLEPLLTQAPAMAAE